MARAVFRNGTGMVNVVCRNLDDDRVLPRFARYLRDGNSWTLTRAPEPHAGIVYLAGYFEAQLCKPWPRVPVLALFTHREEQPPGNDKAKLFDQVAGRVDLRVAMCRLYAGQLGQYGPTIQPPLPVERERFTPSPRPSPGGRGGKMVCGFSGYTYRNHRKGEDLVKAVLACKAGQGVEWRASGRGWPVPTKRYNWRDMPAFYQGLDVLVCTSRVEGGPMPVLEALSCGVSVVVPRGVGILDELPDLAGIHRYARGDPATLVKALGAALKTRGGVDREALRAATAPYTVKAWCQGNAEGIMAMMDGETREVDAGIQEQEQEDMRGVQTRPLPVKAGRPRQRGTGSKRGIYVVAFGDPARKCALRLMNSVKKYLPEIPICLCAAKKIGPESLLVVQPDSDVGGRRAKLRAYDLAPAEWKAVLYLDADTEVKHHDIVRYFEWIEAGWEFVICKDPHLMDTMHNFRRKNNDQELAKIEQQVKTLHALQINGGVWAFARNPRVAAFFRRWQEEWEKYAQRDQGALLRALYADPLKVLWLGNEWNTFPKYCKGIATAGLMHYPGDARRWAGMIPGRIDSQEAWNMVRKHEGKKK